MDLMSGYWQVEMEPESRERTAFINFGGASMMRLMLLMEHYGSYEWLLAGRDGA